MDAPELPHPRADPIAIVGFLLLVALASLWAAVFAPDPARAAHVLASGWLVVAITSGTVLASYILGVVLQYSAVGNWIQVRRKFSFGRDAQEAGARIRAKGGDEHEYTKMLYGRLVIVFWAYPTLLIAGASTLCYCMQVRPDAWRIWGLPVLIALLGGGLARSSFRNRLLHYEGTLTNLSPPPPPQTPSKDEDSPAAAQQGPSRP